MTAPSSTAVPAAATGRSPTNTDVRASVYFQEALSGAAAVLQEVPVVASGAAWLFQEVPLAGAVCKTFLGLQQLVETANSNKGELAVLCDLCDVVIKGVLTRSSNRTGLCEGFAKLQGHVEKAEGVARLCNRAGIREGIKKIVLARRIRDDIASVRENVLAFSTAINLVLTRDLHVSISIVKAPS